MILTIDTGTTNTRVNIWNKKMNLIGESVIKTGVRNTAFTGDNQELKESIRNAIRIALYNANKEMDDISYIIASGMITSDLGIYEIPHLSTPVGLNELSENMVEVMVPDICEKPIWFVPGVKNNMKKVTLSTIEHMDLMRGEEVEVFGLLHRINESGPCLIVLPGSHSKFVLVDKRKRISSSITTLSGELLNVMTNNTILSSSLNHSFVKKLDYKMLNSGSAYAKKVGISRAGFVVRLLDQTNLCTTEQAANFLLGAITQYDIDALKYTKALDLRRDTKIIIAGNNISGKAYLSLFESDNYFSGPKLLLDEKKNENLAGYGAILSLIQKGLLNI